MAALFTRELGPVPNQETGITGELILGLRNDLNNEFLGHELPAGGDGVIQCVRFVQLTDDAAGIRSVSGLQRLKGAVL
ncbi:hypothetical protein ABIB49_003476 [Arthrobacter sp. UYCu512]